MTTERINYEKLVKLRKIWRFVITLPIYECSLLQNICLLLRIKKKPKKKTKTEDVFLDRLMVEKIVAS